MTSAVSKTSSLGSSWASVALGQLSCQKLMCPLARWKCRSVLGLLDAKPIPEGRADAWLCRFRAELGASVCVGLRNVRLELLALGVRTLKADLCIAQPWPPTSCTGEGQAPSWGYRFRS